MNERIQQLVKRASTTTTSYYDGRGNVTETYFDKEKFAKLIVAECIDIAQDRAAFDGYPPNDVNIVIDEIKEHFGVEE